MPTPVTTFRPAADEDRAVSVTWTVHLVRREPRRLLLLASVLLGVLGLGLFLFHSFWLALLPAAALALSLSEFLFPIHYALTAKGAAARHGITALEIAWSDVRHAYLTDEGIKLSPLRRKNARFEPLRGVYLRFDEANREAIIAAVRRFREESADHA